MTDNQTTPGIDAAEQAAEKREWVAPSISTFEAVAVTKAVWFLIGDGINNRS